jgi:NitT/TauT family transport system ATP-binding protein
VTEKKTSTRLSVDSVQKEFVGRGPNEAVEAISEISLDVSEGEFLSIVGPSGAGKTTFLKIIAGLMPASRGQVTVNGSRVTQPLPDFGIVFQNPVLLPWRSALDNVLLPIEMLHLNKQAYRERAHELLDLVGLTGFEHRRPRELSGGMQQRVSLCRALIHDPRILLMDEPFGSLDEFTRESMNDHLLRLWDASRKMVLFVTHNIAEAVYLSDRVAVFTPRPARLAGVISIQLPRPRHQQMRFEAAFIEQMRSVQARLRSAS